MLKRLFFIAALASSFVFVQSAFAQVDSQASGLDSYDSDPGAEHPLFFHIGGARFTPGGFLDFTNIFRTANAGTLGTNFFSIPFNNTLQAHITEDKLTAQNSRLSLKAAGKFGANKVGGYVEADFLGNDAASANVTSNSHTFRLRLYFVDFERGKIEVDAGQMWGWLTPNRKGLSPYPTDVFYTDNEDFNYQVGLTWTRQPAFRFIYHPSDSLAVGVSLENADLFGGQGEVTFPSAFNAQMANEIDETNLSTSSPNWFPDVVPKIAWDPSGGGRHHHIELAGLVSGFKITDLPSVTDAAFATHTKVGFGGSAAVNLQLTKGLHFVSNAFWSEGGGRYIFGMAPDLVVRPVDAPGSTCAIYTIGAVNYSAGCDLALSLVHSAAGIAGFEEKVTPLFTLFAYDGAMYASRNSFVDITSTNTTQPYIGFGGVNSPNNNNRTIHEPTFGWTLAFWSNPQHGTLEMISQESYLTRSPWFVAAGAPKNAHLFMSWIDLRYVLP